MAQKQQVAPTGLSHEIPPKEMFFSTTDRRGVIEQANEVFSRVARYPEAALVGVPHNVIRHPEMPGGAFKLVWDALEQQEATCAYVRNLAGDGSSYWAFATIVPIDNGYLSVRCRPLRQDLHGTAREIYATVRPQELDRRAQGSTAAEAAAFGAGLIEGSLATAGFEDYQAFARAALVAESEARRTSTADEPVRLAPGSTGTILRQSAKIDHEVRSLVQSLGAAQDRASALRATLENARLALDTLVALLDAATPDADPRHDQLVTTALPGVKDKCATVAEKITVIATQVRQVEVNRADVRFSASLAQLQTEMVHHFTLARVQGTEDAEHFDSAVHTLVGCLQRGLGSLAHDAHLDRACLGELRAELDQVGPSLRVTRMMLDRFIQLAHQHGVLDAGTTTELTRQLDHLAQSLDQLGQIAGAVVASSVGFNTTLVDDILQSILEALPARRPGADQTLLSR